MLKRKFSLNEEDGLVNLVPLLNNIPPGSTCFPHTVVHSLQVQSISLFSGHDYFCSALRVLLVARSLMVYELCNKLLLHQ